MQNNAIDEIGSPKPTQFRQCISQTIGLAPEEFAAGTKKILTKRPDIWGGREDQNIVVHSSTASVI
jgi:hypothetical protein